MRLSGVRVGPLLFRTGTRKGEGEGCLVTFAKVLLLPLTLALAAAVWPLLACRWAGRSLDRPNLMALVGVACTAVWLILVATVASVVAVL